MPISIYNSLTRKKEEFIPLKPPNINIYTCGVTVYDESHIGHARSLYIFDVLRQYLKYRGFKVRFVRNITDIDDKIINRSKELKVDWQELVKKYIDRYYEDIKTLGIKKADYEPRATENVPDMIKHIEKLIERGYAYITDSGVYFSVRKFKDYGKLSGQSVDSMLSGVRIEPDEKKQDPLDFALWKKSKPDEPSWDSPWSGGRPGWHIECSVMSMKYLKTDTLDIHAGGCDLIFPHHENEIAQSESLTDKLFAKYWIHHGLLTINGQKMAKSLGNFITIKDFINKHGDVDILKFFFLTTHYSHPIDYTEEKIKETKEALERILILMNKIERKIKNQKSLPVRQAGKIKIKKFEEIENIKNKFIETMDDNFNTPQALACVFELVNVTNKQIEELDFIYNAKNTLEELLDILGISLKIRERIQITDEQIKIKISDREKARRERNYALSDKIRKELEEEGIILEDTKEGTTWRRKI